MKTILILNFLLFFSRSYSQEILKIKQIDSLVLSINNSILPAHHDTIIQDRPELGLKMITYLSMIVSGEKLIKYVNFVNTIREDNGKFIQIITSNTFYYHENKLIKVEVTQNQYDALVDFAYNLGVANLASSTLLKKVNAKLFNEAAEQFPRWNKAGGVVLTGLTKRRNAEKDLFLS